jgi:hypothetical protein
MATDYELVPLATWGGSFISINLTSRADTLLAGDAMRSITLLRFTPSPTPTLVEVARDYNAHYMAAVESLAAKEDDDTKIAGEEFIGAETDLNLFTVQKEDVTTTRSMTDEMGFTERGGFHLGEMVSKFCRGASNHRSHPFSFICLTSMSRFTCSTIQRSIRYLCCHCNSEARIRYFSWIFRSHR